MASHGKIPTLGANVAIAWWTDGQPDRLALAHPYNDGSCSKFGRILPSDLGGDSMMEGWTDTDLLAPPPEGHMGQSEK